MEALVKFGRQDGDVEIREISEPIIGSDEVLLEVKAVGVCGSDLHMWRESHSWSIKLVFALMYSPWKDKSINLSIIPFTLKHVNVFN